MTYLVSTGMAEGTAYNVQTQIMTYLVSTGMAEGTAWV